MNSDNSDNVVNVTSELGTAEQRTAIADLVIEHTDFVQFGCCSGTCPQGFVVSDSPVPLRIIDDEGNQVKMTQEQFKILIDSFLSLESA